MSVHATTERAALRLATTLLALGTLAACSTTASVGGAPSIGTSSAITVDDLRARLYAYAADSMMGRDAPGPWNDKATDYIAGEMRRLGLEPAGENGTYFQSVLITQTLDVAASSITVDGQTFRANTDFLPRWQAPVMRSIAGAQVVHGGTWGSANTMVDPAQTAGKVVLFLVPPQPNGQPGWQANRAALTQRYANAAGIVVASLDAMPAETRAELGAATPALRGQQMPPTMSALPQFFYVTGAAARAMLGGDPAGMQMGATGRTVGGSIVFRETAAQARNVVAVLRGSDPALRNTYVAVGSHNDHVGFNRTPVDHDSLRAFNAVVRPGGADNPARAATPDEMTRVRAILDSLRRIRPARPDSIFNGADDDGSGTIAMIEIAEAMAAGPRPKRSILFVFHTAEEDGLLGAAYYAEHSTVPRDSIVAMVNMDMIGRGAATDLPGGRPGYVQLIGSRRLSTQLGDLVEAVNARRPESARLFFDYQYDANGHPQQYYCRSDHYHYARFGIPVVFLSAGGHRDYHQVTDEPQYIEYDSFHRVTTYLHELIGELGNRTSRVVVDKPKQDPNAQCRQ